MDASRCPCVFPSLTEEELITIPGDEPDTAFRLFVEPGPRGYVRLQQLAHADGIGWYVQKSMVLPGEVLPALLPQLRKANCLIPQQEIAEQPEQPLRFPRPVCIGDLLLEAKRKEA